MYEKPQYMTPGGLRRGNRNPSSEGTPLQKAPKKKGLTDTRITPGRKISPEAAKLIAEAIRCMLRNR